MPIVIPDSSLVVPGVGNFVVGRLAFDDPLIWHEQVGDPITNLGGAVVPNLRTALRHAVTTPTFTGVTSDTVAQRKVLRAQLRSLLNNTPMKLGGLYVAWASDPEQNGWYAPDQGMFVDGDGSSGLATGWWNLDQVNWYKMGVARTHRRASLVYLKDRRLGTTFRDLLKLLYVTDFTGLTALALTYLPAAGSDFMNAVTGQPLVTLYALPAGADIGRSFVASGSTDLEVISYEQNEPSRNQGDVVVHDRQGNITKPSSGPDSLWVEVYGQDFPFSSNDVVVLENGRCRVRFDTANLLGFAVDYWSGGATPVWAEQGKMTFKRRDDVLGNVDIDSLLQPGWVVEYTQDRAVIAVALRASAHGNYSRERLFITLQRGWAGPRFELYVSIGSGGGTSGSSFVWQTNGNDTNDSLVKIDAANTGAISASASSTPGGSNLPSVTIGASTFTNENEVMLLRQGQPFAAAFAPVHASLLAASGNGSLGYATSSALLIFSLAATNPQYLGYQSCHVGFSTAVADQIMEAEAMTLGSGTTSGGDASASGGVTTQSSRSSDANAHATRNSWPNGAVGKYRVFVRCKTTATQMSAYAKTGGTTGATKTLAGSATPSYSWVDLGDILSTSTTFELHAWVSSGSGIVEVDRLEAHLVEDRTATIPTYSGGRDLGQSVLYDSRTTPTQVTR